MALKFRITKAAYGKLSDEIKEFYEADGDTHFKLDVDGLEDTGALQRANDRLKDELSEAKDELKTVKKEKTTLEATVGDGGAADIQKLTRSHERKLATAAEEHTTTLKGRDDFIRKILVSAEAEKLANVISTVPTIMVGHIEKRMSVNFEGSEPKLVILDKDGKPAAAGTVDTLKQELLTDASLKPILKGSQASGSSAPPAARQAGNASGTPQVTDESGKKVNVNALDTKSFVDRVRASREAEGKTDQQTA